MYARIFLRKRKHSLKRKFAVKKQPNITRELVLSLKQFAV